VKDPLEEAGEEVGRPLASAMAITFVAFFVALFIARPGARVPIAIAVGIIVMVMLHECGHYYTAKKSGMKVTEFFLGFGPRVWSFRRGETEYGVKAIPAGGYVRIIGMSNLEEVDPADEDRSFRSKKFLPRFVVVLAGVTVNLILAFALFFAMFAFDGIGTDRPTTTIDQVIPESPAADAGLRKGDQIVALGGQTITNWEQVSPALEDRAGTATKVIVERNGSEQVLQAEPAQRSATDSSGCLGVVPATEHRELTVAASAKESGLAMARVTQGTGGGLARLFSLSGLRNYGNQVVGSESESVRTCAAPERPTSIIGIVDSGSQIVGSNVWDLLFLLGLVSLVLALFNLLPLLPFDGGHAAVAVYEGIRSRISGRPYRADFRKLLPVTAVVLFLLLALSRSAMFLDVRSIGS